MLLDDVRREIRTRHYSIRTEHAYTDWTTRYVRFHKLRHPLEMGRKTAPPFFLRSWSLNSRSISRVSRCGTTGIYPMDMEPCIFPSPCPGSTQRQQGMGMAVCLSCHRALGRPPQRRASAPPRLRECSAKGSQGSHTRIRGRQGRPRTFAKALICNAYA
jgi:hypothetical protein